jgi:hypothetical protein
MNEREAVTTRPGAYFVWMDSMCDTRLDAQAGRAKG